MAAAATNTPTRGHLLHVGFMVPLNELMFENEVLERELGRLNLRFNTYSAVLFYKTSDQGSLHGWFEQRKRSSLTSKAPIELKKDISRGLFGERKPFVERIQVPCFPYKCDANAGFIECEAFATFKEEYRNKRETLQSQQAEQPGVL
ncbi:unnamed protein product [Rotaria socialis]|uniref:Uncharacterized protein n=1 Tax=Rotaria socialis TaxID=392032 RepID=A0A818NA55_9BILA|nr:unnamed protein product [Rotaria socialis]CAF3603570.1 unnamed protein product [Rotaria socialis]